MMLNTGGCAPRSVPISNGITRTIGATNMIEAIEICRLRARAEIAEAKLTEARPLLAEAAEALAPFAEYADHTNKCPAWLEITSGSAVAKKQLKMEDCYRARTVAAKIAALAAPVKASEDRVRHKKRGTTYTVITRDARLQLLGCDELDNAQVTIYRADEDGRLWVRPTDEFEDGRFEQLPAIPPAPKPSDVVVIWSKMHEMYWTGGSGNGWVQDAMRARLYRRSDAEKIGYCMDAVELRPAPMEGQMIFVDALTFLLKGFAIKRECFPEHYSIRPDQPFYQFSVEDMRAGDWLYLDPKSGWVR